jgi:4-amino-4-deoxy-L-arabinose transferase-like glycosyltransferase
MKMVVRRHNHRVESLRRWVEEHRAGEFTPETKSREDEMDDRRSKRVVVADDSPTNNMGGAVVGVVIALLLAPSVIWIFRDQSVWPWDQAHYAELSLRIAHAANQGPLAWLSAFITVPPTRAPLLPWLAQITAPLADILGSVERALILINILAGVAALGLLFSTVRGLGGSTIAGIAAMLLCGGSSLFIGLTQEFLVEPVQIMTVAAFMCVSIEADRASWLRLLALTVMVATLAMLAKTTSVGFVAPLIVYMVLVRVLMRDAPKQASGTPTDYVLAAAAVALAAVGSAWYMLHWKTVIGHVLLASVSDIALLYGSTRGFGPKLGVWIAGVLHALSPWHILATILVGIIVAALSIATLRQVKTRSKKLLTEAVASGLLFAFCLAGTVAAALLTYSMQINEDIRLASPIIPMLAVLLGWSLSVLRQSWLAAAILLALGANAMANHAHDHGFISLANIYGWVKPPQLDASARDRLTRATLQSCDKEHSKQATIIGLDLIDFNPVSASFLAEKDAPMLGYRCVYGSLGYAETNVQRALARVENAGVVYFVTFPHDKVPPPTFDPFNRVAKPVAELIAANPDFERITTAGGAFEIYRRKR